MLLRELEMSGGDTPFYKLMGGVVADGVLMYSRVLGRFNRKLGRRNSRFRLSMPDFGSNFHRGIRPTSTSKRKYASNCRCCATAMCSNSSGKVVTA